MLPALLVVGMYFGGVVLHRSQTGEGFAGEPRPGFEKQWLEQRLPIYGTIPPFLPAIWGSWDKSQVTRRGADQLVENYYPLGPKDVGGRTRSIWIDPRNENIILAAAISGGVWRSEDRGNTWNPINDQEVTLIASCFTSSPFNPDIVYYGTGEGRPAGPANMGGNGIYKSTNGGRSFSALASTINTPGFDIVWDLKHSLDDSNTLFAGTHTSGLWKSTNGGITWQQVFNGGNLQVNNILVLPKKRILISMQSNFVYASDSNGNAGSWKLVSFPSFPSAGTYSRMQLANCKNFPNRCYMIVEAKNFLDTALAFYASSDGGKSWNKMPRPSFVGASYQIYCLMLGVHPENPDRIIAGGVNIAQSNDGGKTWNKKGIGHSDHHGYTAYPVTSSKFLIGTDGGIYEYDWDVKNFVRDLNKGYIVTQFYAGGFGPYGSVSISGAQDNGVHVANGLLNTKKFNGSDGAYCHIGQQDGKVAYFSTQDTGLRRIRNFDPNIVPSKKDRIADPAFGQDKVDFINCYAMNPADQNQLYYRTNKYLYRSLDGGDNWFRLTGYHGGLKPIAVSDESNPTVYTGGSIGQLYRIDNAATTASGSEINFNAQVPGSITDDFISCIVIHPLDKNTIYISLTTVSSQARIWKVTNMNSTPIFTAISGNLPPFLPVNYLAVDPASPDKNLFAGTDFGLYISTDSGKSWEKDHRFPNVAVHEIKMRADRHLFIYTHGRGTWLAALKGSKNPFPKAAIRIFPNPASAYLDISLSTVPTTQATITLFDHLGKKVLSASFATDFYRLMVDQLAPGQYYARLKTDKETSTEKILIVRP